MKLLAVCTGMVAPLVYRTASGEVKTEASGIRKSPVSTLESPQLIALGKLGLEKDEQCNLAVHGGIDKAVYMMPAQHYEFWRERRAERSLSIDLKFGQLGENLIVEGLSEESVYVGDEIEIGEVLLMVTDPREPCHKFAIRMEYGAAPKQMIQSGFSGWYLKVIRTGKLSAGQKVKVIPGPRRMTVLEKFRRMTKKGQLDLL